MDIKQKAVQQAIKMLDASGARYHIVTESGEVFGAAIVWRQRAPRQPSVIEHYKERLIALNPGESMFLYCMKEQQEKFQLAAASFLGAKFGAGNYMTARCEQGVEVLILDKAKKDDAPKSQEYPAPIFMIGGAK